MTNNISNTISKWIEETMEVCDEAALPIDVTEIELNLAFDNATSGDLVQSLTGFSMGEMPIK